MSEGAQIQKKGLYEKIRAMSNRNRFRIIELTQSSQINITTLSSILKLSYTKCADYVRLLERKGLVGKTRSGKEVLVKSRVRFRERGIEFA